MRLLLASLLVQSCTTISERPSGAPSLDALSVRIATNDELSASASIMPSPYEPPDGLFVKSDQGFVVLVIEVTGASGANQVELTGMRTQEKGISFQTRDAFIAWWKNRNIYEGSDHAWERYIRQTYLPPGNFRLSRGDSTYFAVLMGKRPIPKPLSIEARFKVDGQERIFNISMDE